jgi:hypothetical protein
MEQSEDTVIRVEVYYITAYETAKQAYEAHYLHNAVKLKKEIQLLNFYKGDYIVLTNQECNYYIIQTLEPQGVDSYFAWNFFDGILQQKEWYSDYVFEEMAVEILASDPTLKSEFEKKKLQEAEFAKNPRAQLLYIYQHSKYYEKSHNRYPVVRINETIDLPVE